jgi:hypothetical protein
MMGPDDLTSLDRDALLALVVEQQRQLAAGTAHLEALQAEIERFTRGAKR